MPPSRRRTVPPPYRGLLHPAFGPLVPARVRGPGARLVSGLAVLDTGAIVSAVDREVARTLDLPTPGAATWAAITATGLEREPAALRRAGVAVGRDERLWELDLIEVPGLGHVVEGYHVLVLLGWDFLRRCHLSLDGPAGTFSLGFPR